MGFVPGCFYLAQFQGSSTYEYVLVLPPFLWLIVFYLSIHGLMHTVFLWVFFFLPFGQYE